MIVALKELSIRGDFQTTVEYLIKLLETPTFEADAMTTDWLDELITKKKLMVKHPDPILVAICGAACKAYIDSEACIAEYRMSLERASPCHGYPKISLPHRPYL